MKDIKNYITKHIGMQEQVDEMDEEISELQKENSELQSIALLNKQNFDKMTILYEASQKQLKSFENKLNNALKKLKEVNEKYELALTFTDIGKMEQEVKEIDEKIESRKRKADSNEEVNTPNIKRRNTTFH